VKAPGVGDEVDVRVRAIAAGGAGVADLPDGRVAFVHRTAPGDRARVRITAEKRSWAKAELVAVGQPGPGRRPAPCPFYERCGGCTLEHLAYSEQLRWKGRIVADALGRIGRIDVPPPAVEPSPQELRYRNRVTFTLRRLAGPTRAARGAVPPPRVATGGHGPSGGTRVVAGFHELDHPERVLDLTGSCLLPEEPIARVWDALRAAWGGGAERLPAGPRLRLTLRTVAEGVVLVVDGGSGSWAPDALLRDVHGLVAIWHQGGGARAPLLVAGSARAHELWLGEPVRPGARAFLQVNRGAAERLHAAVMAAAVPWDRSAAGLSVVDAYCGVGVYGRTLARAGARVTGIELDPEAAAAARAGAPEGFRVIEGAVEARLGDALPAALAILNPPRTGVDERVTTQLSASSVERVIYVSCDPATLARDLGRLAGYTLAGLHAFDLFPQTAHVETVAVLRRDGG
jgi:23S rRNA (uracil1939-C5)-methyltransferase